MDVIEMLGQLGHLLNDPNEGRYDAFVKLTSLNIAQRELMSGVPASELADLIVYNYLLHAGLRRPGPVYSLPLPLDFFKEISSESIIGSRTGAFKLFDPQEYPTFPFDGHSQEPVVKIMGKRLSSFGRPFDQDVRISYYRWPRRMTMNGVENGFVVGTDGDAGKVVKGPVWIAANIDCELRETSHMAVVSRAQVSLLRSDQEIKEVVAER